MPGAYDPSRPIPQQNTQVAIPVQQQQQPQEYQYQGNTFSSMPSNDQSAQVRKALFDIAIPTVDTDYGQWIPMFQTMIDAAPRIPGIDSKQFKRITRKFKDMVARAHSQGRKRMTAATCQELLFELRLLVSVVDTTGTGMSGVTAMVTTNQNVRQEVHMPQQPTSQGFWPFGRK